jgi:hypothetical protein
LSFDWRLRKLKLVKFWHKITRVIKITSIVVVCFTQTQIEMTFSSPKRHSKYILQMVTIPVQTFDCKILGIPWNFCRFLLFYCHCQTFFGRMWWFFLCFWQSRRDFLKNIFLHFSPWIRNLYTIFEVSNRFTTRVVLNLKIERIILIVGECREDRISGIWVQFRSWVVFIFMEIDQKFDWVYIWTLYGYFTGVL